jgi:hypothetical protein
MSGDDTVNGLKPLRAFFAEYVEHFFSGDSLQRILLYMCNKCTLEVTDPLCSTLKMFLTTPIVFGVTRLGLVPFKDCTMAVFPYTHMTIEQKQFILGFLAAIQPRSAGRVSTQLGGGCLVMLGRVNTDTVNLRHSDVLICFCKAVIANNSYGTRQTRLSVCNVVLQRLGVVMGISRGTLQAVYDAVADEGNADEGNAEAGCEGDCEAGCEGDCEGECEGDCCEDNEST